jgi:hypothetical protein
VPRVGEPVAATQNAGRIHDSASFRPIRRHTAVISANHLDLFKIAVHIVEAPGVGGAGSNLAGSAQSQIVAVVSASFAGSHLERGSVVYLPGAYSFRFRGQPIGPSGL